MTLRVASLLPAATEMVCALGARDLLVGVSHECDHPADVAALPRLTRPRREAPGSSLAIDRSVRALAREALGVYELDVAALERLQPDVILTQDLCDVCAVSFRDVERGVQALLRRGARIVSLHPRRFEDLFAGLAEVGAALRCRERVPALERRLRERVAGVSRRAATCTERPRVVTVEWLEPVMLGGTWMPELCERAGAEALGVRAGEKAPTLSREELAALDPDAVVLKPCGFSLERTLEERHLLPRVLPWELWRAVRQGQVFVADGSAYFNRPGPRLVDSLEILAACLHPAAFPDLRERHSGSVRRVAADLTVHAP